MKLPLQTTIHNIPHSTALEQYISYKANKLNHFCDHIMACRIVLEMPQKHQHQGKLYNIRIDLTVPGKELVVNRNPNEDIYVALRDAFADARRKLETYADTKLHSHGRTHTDHKLPMHGYVSKLFPEQGYGFIETWDGEEIYFNECTLLKCQFKQLRIGSRVHFLEEEGLKGPQATRVRFNRLMVEQLL